MNHSLVLVVNCGSSSLKLAIVEPESGRRFVQALAERLFTAQADMTIHSREAGKTVIRLPDADHAQAFELFAAHLSTEKEMTSRIIGVSHRVVHGGEYFRCPVLVDGDVLQKINACSGLAPLHNPANLQGIHAAIRHFPELPQVAVFDTAFHQTLPETAYLYAIPYELYEKHQLRRYGFHGTSHNYLMLEAARRLGRPADQLNLLTLHLGNGCSACAIRQGRSVDTTMGLTPLEGLVMGTRSGDLDPGLILHLLEHMDFSSKEVDELLNRRSGLQGLSGLSNDMRTLAQAAQSGNRQARLAIEVFCFRLAKNIAALSVSCAPLDALVFSGGIGENSVQIRQRTLAWLAPLGFAVDEQNNRVHGKDSDGRISPMNTPDVRVIPTDEEVMLARGAVSLIAGESP